MTDRAENLLIAACFIIVGWILIAIDESLQAWLLEWWPVMLIVGASSVLSAAISGFLWYRQGYVTGQSVGFDAGEKQAFTWRRKA